MGMPQEKKMNETFVFVPPYPDGSDHQDLVELSLQQINEMDLFSNYNCGSMVGDLSYSFGQPEGLQLEQHQQYYNFAQVQDLQLEQQQQSVLDYQCATGSSEVGIVPFSEDTNTVIKQAENTSAFLSSNILPYKIYDAASRNFFVYYRDEYGIAKTNTFSAQRYGLSTAERLADKRLRELGVEVESPETNIFSRFPENSLSVAASTTPTITYDKKRRVFVVSWRDATMYDMTKHFSAQRFGLSVAEELANEFFQSLHGTIAKVSNEATGSVSKETHPIRDISQTCKKKKVGTMFKKKYINRQPKKSLVRLNTIVPHSESSSYLVQWTDEKGVAHSKIFPDVTNDSKAESTARKFMDKLLLTCRASGEVRLAVQLTASTRNLSRSRLASLQEMAFSNDPTKLLEDTGLVHVLAMKCRKKQAGYFTNRKALVAKPTVHCNFVNGKIVPKMKKVVLSRQVTGGVDEVKNPDVCHGVILAAAKRLSRNRLCKARKKFFANRMMQPAGNLPEQDEDDSTQPSTPSYDDSTMSVLSSSVCTTSRWHISYTCNDSTVQIPITCIRRLARGGGIICLKYITYRGKGGICFKNQHRE